VRGEPFVHFVVLGAALFGLYHLVAPPQPSRQLVISTDVVHALRQDYLRRNGTPPTRSQEQALVQQYIDTEILYREALALGLDRGDVIVRRRLVQKMEFLTEGMEPDREPADTELQSYLAAHAQRYAEAERVALTHVFVSLDRHGAETESVARQLSDQLAAGADASTLGDPFIRGHAIPLHTESELAAIFGTAFAAQVMTLPAGSWSAPLRSSYGVHLVRVTERQPGRLPELGNIRDAVRRDWQEERRAAADRTAMARLRQRYDIRVEADAARRDDTAEASELPTPTADRQAVR